MANLLRTLLASLMCFSLFACGSQPTVTGTSVTLLFTNDLESAYDPTPAYWRDDLDFIGGVAELATLIDNYRQTNENVFLFDAGDIFTGTLAQLTRGEIAFELMLSMGYDAMGIGNHEFEFGWEEFAIQKQRASFPVLGANLSYKDGGAPYAQAYSVIERNGVRIGVIGVMGQDAATALIPSNLAGVEVTDPVAAVKKYVGILRESVDLIVVLTHHGPTAPMQTDDEAAPEVYRGNAENLALAAAVPGIDVILAGHTDAGTPEALKDPVNGTLIMQTWGQGQHLGVLQLEIADHASVASTAGQMPRAKLVHSALAPVASETLKPHPVVAAKLADYRQAHQQIFTVIGTLNQIASRAYYRESVLGNLLADIVRDESKAQVGLMPSGALRKDLPKGDLRRVDVQDMFPFKDRVALVELSGETLVAVIEQGLSLERGLLQVSGVEVSYDPSRAVGERLVDLRIAGESVDLQQRYSVATLEILAQGGDSYVQFRDAELLALSKTSFGEQLVRYFSNKSVSPNGGNGSIVQVPAIGRYRDIH